MDDQDLEQQQRLLMQAMEELEKTGSMTAESFDRLRNSTSKTAKAVDKAEDAIEKWSRTVSGKTTKALGKLAKGATDSALEARKNRESFASLNPVINAAGDALSAIPIAGEALGAALKGIGNFVTSELDDTVKAFRTLGSVGGIGAAGVSGLRESAERAGLSFEQLASVTSNRAGGLAFVFGSTATGLTKIAELTQAAEPFREQLLALGLGFEEQSEVFVDYIERSQRLGRVQERDQRLLAQRSAEYAKNLTDLSRITGASIDEAQSALDAQMSNIRFRRAMTELDADIQKSVSNVGVVISQIGNDPALAQGFQDLVAGFGTQAGRDFAIATGGVGQQVADQLKAGVITEQQAVEQIQGALKATYEKLPAQVFGAGTPFDNVSLGMANLATAQIDYATALKQGEDAAKATDPATAQMVDAQLALQRFAVATDEFVNNQVFPRATEVMQTFTDQLAKLADNINNVAEGNVGVSPGGSVGLGTALTGAAGGAGLGFLLGGPIGAALGGILGTLAPSINFGGARAEGGPVDAGKGYLVGEEGPELIIPETPGNVLPADTTRQLGGRGAVVEQAGERAEYARLQGLVQSINENESQIFNHIEQNRQFVEGTIAQLQSMSVGERIETDTGESVSKVNTGRYEHSTPQGTTVYNPDAEWIVHKLPALVEGMARQLYADGRKYIEYGFSGGKLGTTFDASDQPVSQKVLAGFGGQSMQIVKDLVQGTQTASYISRIGAKDSDTVVQYMQSFKEQLGESNLSIQGLKEFAKSAAQSAGYDPTEYFGEGFRQGGIASGPKSGYTALLHGTEAVVPLPDGKNIPVETGPGAQDENKMLGLMESMNQILQQVASNTRTGADTSKKLLRASAG